MTSLRHAIVVRMAVLLLLVGIVSAAAAYVYAREEAQTTFDAQIRQFATFVAASDPPSAGGALPAAPGADDFFLVQMWDATGKLIWASDNSNSAVAPSQAGYSNSDINGARWRSFTLLNPSRITRVSLPLDESNEQAATAALQIAVPMVVVVPLSWLLLSVMINRVLGGLDRAAALIRRRKAHERGKVPDDGLPEEVKPFVASINELVKRLDESVAQQKRFVADAAHELRTPLTAIGIQINNLETALTTKAQRERLAPLQDGARRANQLVEQLLQLARTEQDLPAAEQDAATLDVIFKALNAIFSPIAASRNIALTFEGGTSSLALAQRDAVLVLSALIENAINYAPAETSVVVAASNVDVTITDEGPGIAPEKLPHVFERFYRAGSATPGTGLGLSIAKAICDRRGWVLRLENRDDGKGLRAVLTVKSTSH